MDFMDAFTRVNWVKPCICVRYGVQVHVCVRALACACGCGHVHVCEVAVVMDIARVPPH